MFKKFISYYKPYKFLFFADLVCALIVACIDLAFPQLLRLITNGSLLGGNDVLGLILYLAGGLLLLYVVRYFCQYFMTSWGHIMGARMETDMRRNLFYHYQRLSFSYYDKNNTGEMLSRLVSDLFDISELAHHGPENLLISILKIVGSVILLVMINPFITLILVCVVVFMAVFSYIMNKRMKKVFTDNRKKIASVNARVQDSLLGIKVIKSFAREEAEHRKFDEANEAFLSTKSSSYRAMGKYHAVNSFFEGLLYVAALVAGGIFFVNRDITAMEFAMYFLYIGIFINPIDLLINFTEMFQQGFSGFRRFQEVVETAPETEESLNAKIITHVDGKI
ncbi:MAG: ABC transporter ATP-binding protein [Clostridiales bacterium]|jgi:ATP-binding cassette subfamily B protein|nr:ABC transporter ATP-binding protein [Clostridiales bacterium]